MAKDLTVFNDDGSIERAGFVPWFGYYKMNAVSSRSLRRDWYNDDGT